MKNEKSTFSVLFYLKRNNLTLISFELEIMLNSREVG